jgi:Na+/proline symporter
MVSIVLVAIIVIGVALVAMALLIWRRQKGDRLEIVSVERKRAFIAQWIAGIVLALIAAAFAFDGHILEENTTGISTVIGSVGISLIATCNVHLLPLKHK